MRGLFELYDPESSRMGLAVEQFVDGSGFTWEGVWFRREGERLVCAVISPWHGPGLTEVQAQDLLAGAHDALAHLLSVSAPLTAVVNGLERRFLIIRDDETSWDVVAEQYDDRLEWRLYDPGTSTG